MKEEEMRLKIDSDFIKRNLGYWLYDEKKNDAIEEFAKTKQGQELVDAMRDFLIFCNDLNFEAQNK